MPQHLARLVLAANVAIHRARRHSENGANGSAKTWEHHGLHSQKLEWDSQHCAQTMRSIVH